MSRLPDYVPTRAFREPTAADLAVLRKGGSGGPGRDSRRLTEPPNIAVLPDYVIIEPQPRPWWQFWRRG